MEYVPRMSAEAARWWLAGLWAVFAAVRIHYHRLAGPGQRTLRSEYESPSIRRLRLVFVAWLALALAYVARPSLVAWAGLPLAPGARSAGAGLFVLGILLVLWVQRTLGRNFSGTLVLREDHVLVVDGPYRYVRHPMYPSFLVAILGMLLLTANLAIGLPPLLGVLWVMAVRTPDEERMMVDRFGERYREFMRTRPRYLPRLRRAQPGGGPD